MQLEKGVVYGVSGLPWLRETIVSAASLKRCMPDMPIELHIAKETTDLLSEEVDLSIFFDFIVIHDTYEHWRSLKFEALKSDRFGKILFLDVDTYITGRFDELFDVLDKFDITAMHAPQRIHPASIESGLYDLYPDVPISFPEYNAGVISFRRNKQVIDFIDQWFEFYERGRKEKNYFMDQPAFRVAMYHSDIRICALTPEYNLRAGVPNVVKGDIKIIHAHGYLEQLASSIDLYSEQIRVIMPQNEILFGMIPKGGHPDQQTESELKNVAEEIQSDFDLLKRMMKK